MYNGLPITGVADEEVQKAANGNGTSYYILKNGVYSRAAANLQTMLRDLGYLASGVDGYFGNYTEDSVKDYQRTNGLYVDGTVGMKTLKSLLLSPVASYGSKGLAAKELSRGAEGDDVVNLQKRLAQLGYLASPADGDYGVYTELAVKVFQIYNNIPATGTADLTTIATLNSAKAVSWYALSPSVKGIAIGRIQEILQKLGYLNSDPDWDYGLVTKKAVITFQRMNGLYPDGIVGAYTLTKMLLNPVAYDPSEKQQYTEAELIAIDVLDYVGWTDLYTVYKWVVQIPYVHIFTGYTVTDSAYYTFTNNGGDCLGKAAVFCVLARVMGYDCQVIWGAIPYSWGGTGDHAWCEFMYNGATYVCDPEFELEVGNNGYMINYGQSGTWQYIYGFIVDY